MKRSTIVNVLTPALAACLLVGLVGCATTRQVKEDQQSGFLGDYSMLEKGEKGEANYIYIDTNANWSKYTKIWIKPVELWKSDDPESRINKMDEETQKMLPQEAYNALYEGLTNNFQIVDQGGPDVLIVHAAITDGRPSKPVINFVSSVYLPLKVISFGKRLITGTDVGVGVVFVEAEFLDGQTGQRVCAAMDARAGTKALRTKFNSTWNDAKLAFEWWGQRMDKRLMLFKQGDFGTANL
jgi:xanthosine utilization system XapX-like protein